MDVRIISPTKMKSIETESNRNYSTERVKYAPETVISLYREAEAGSLDACNELGCRLLKGLDVTKDWQAAVTLFKKAAEEGHALGCKNLGFIFQHGLGVEKDLKEALRWFDQAYKLNAPDVLQCIEMVEGEIHAFELYKQKNYIGACKLFDLLANAGVAIAQIQLGLIYMNSPNVPNYMGLASHCFSLADNNKWKTPKIAFALGGAYMAIPAQFRSRNHVIRALENYEIAWNAGSKNAELKYRQILAGPGGEGLRG